MMDGIPTQVGLEEVSDEYKAFLDKFKAKKTTDNCYTPENVYNAVRDWVCKEYGVDPANVIRPFWPGGDYERYPYKDSDVVVDNPPFSIIAKIAKFYARYGIKFFIFTPYLTNLGIGRGDKSIQHIIARADITYENGANVNTAFVTNMDEWFIRSVPELGDLIKAENDKNLKAIRKQQPKYSYPPEVITSADIGYMAVHHTPFAVKHEDCRFITRLDSQKAAKKELYGGGFLLSERAAAERAAAERAAATRWELSDREREIMKSLGAKKEGGGDDEQGSD